VIKDKGKKIGFMAVAAAIAIIASAFLQPPPGMSGWVTFVGTVAALAGSGIGIYVHDKAPGWLQILFALIAVVAAVFAVNGYREVTGREPGPEPANELLYWAAGIFVCVGLVTELAGLKLTSAEK
jgi:hypothetical protein